MKFCWLSKRAAPPPEWDLRDEGWVLHAAPGWQPKESDAQWGDEEWAAIWARLGDDSPAQHGLSQNNTAPNSRNQPKNGAMSAPCSLPLLVDMAPATRPPLPQNRALRQRALALGVEHSDERARWIKDGFGDAMAMHIAKPELSARLARIAQHRICTPMRRPIGPLTLDLLHRDAQRANSWLALHPREFALLWWLADHRPRPVSTARLLAEIWRVEHDPGTNRVAVHISRLRQKLTAAGCPEAIITDPSGGYRLAIDPLET